MYVRSALIKQKELHRVLGLHFDCSAQPFRCRAPGWGEKRLFFYELFVAWFLLQCVNFPNANLLVFLFPGFIVIPKPSQLSQWNSSIATIFLLLKNTATQSLMLPFTLQALQVSFSFPTLPDFVDGFPFFFFLVNHSLGLEEEWSKKKCGAIVDDCHFKSLGIKPSIVGCEQDDWGLRPKG